MKTIKHIFKIVVIALFAFGCSNDECGYGEPCTESCDLFEDFESEVVGNSGNWQGIADSGVFFETRNGSTVLHANDGSGSSWAYNTVDFPSDLLTQGCALQFDIEYDANSGNNSGTVASTITIFDGASPIANTIRAIFVLNPSSVIVSGASATTIEIPLNLATGTTLPNNSFGEWRISGITIPTAADIANFNTLIQNISGVGFPLDSGGTPSEQYWYDNFCFKQCCP